MKIVVLISAVLLMSGSALAQQGVLTPKLVDRTKIVDCMMPLARERIDRTVQVSCSVSSSGRMQRCTVPDAQDLPSRQQRAATCIAGLYEVENFDTSTGGSSTVNFPITLRINVSPPPSFTPPPS